MKKPFAIGLASMLVIAGFVLGCNKEKVIQEQGQSNPPASQPKTDTCANPSSKGRVIGYNSCYQFFDSIKVMGRGFMIEIDNVTTKDTVATYTFPNGVFKFYSSYIDLHYGEFFKKEIQEKLKIKFNYRLALESEKIAIPCVDNIFSSFVYLTKNRQILMSCVSPQ